MLEIDGSSHLSAEAQEKDKERDRQMEALGLKVIRVKDNDVRRDPDRVTDWLMEQFRELSQSEF